MPKKPRADEVRRHLEDGSPAAAVDVLLRIVEAQEREIQLLRSHVTDVALAFNNHSHAGYVEQETEYSSARVVTDTPISSVNPYGGSKALRIPVVVEDQDEEAVGVHDIPPFDVPNIEIDAANTPFDQVVDLLDKLRVRYEVEDYFADEDPRTQRLAQTGARRYIDVGNSVRHLIFADYGQLLAVDTPYTGSIRVVKSRDAVAYVRGLIERLKKDGEEIFKEEEEESPLGLHRRLQASINENLKKVKSKGGPYLRVADDKPVTPVKKRRRRRSRTTPIPPGTDDPAPER